jgi:hypothetical protein
MGSMRLPTQKHNIGVFDSGLRYPQDSEDENPRERSGSTQASAFSPPNPTNRSH